MLPLVETLAACPGCGGVDVKPLHVFRNIKPVVATPFLALVGCTRCGLAYTSPRPSEQELSHFYDATVDGGWAKGRDFDDPATAEAFTRSLALKHSVAARLLDSLGAIVSIPERPGRHAFDFGCGAGAFLDVLQDRGWKTTGLEPARLREFAGRRHTMTELVPDTESFDLVNVNHVLEHLLYPARTLEALARASRPGAVLLCSVPDLQTLPQHRDFGYVSNPVHLNSFTTASLTTLMQRTGWRPIRVTSGGLVLEPSSKATTRLTAVGVRDAGASTLPLPTSPLTVAEKALRAYGRLLGPDGKPR
jgi:hypothetical protein